MPYNPPKRSAKIGETVYYKGVLSVIKARVTRSYQDGSLEVEPLAFVTGLGVEVAGEFATKQFLDKGEFVKDWRRL